MAPAPTYGELKNEFSKTFAHLAPYRHRYEVFTDFVTMIAITLNNSLFMNQKREDEYLEIIRRYQKKDQHTFPKLLGLLVDMLTFEPRDVLGELFMDLELGNKNSGQFFTPQAVSELMAKINLGPQLANLDKEFITISEPACGAGGMILAVVKECIACGHDPAQRLWVQAIDVDRKVALMCFSQLTLWHVPAQVIVGNTLTLEVREVWYTPAHHLGFWENKLRRDAKSHEGVTQPPSPTPIDADISLDPEQLGFDF